MMSYLNLEGGHAMKHWMAIVATAALATGLSLFDGTRQDAAVTTPGLPRGWLSEGQAAGLDEVGVRRPQGGGGADLLITRKRDAGTGTPLVVYQTIDAVPWRGRTIVFSSYTRVQLAPEVMRRTGGAAVAELHIECDGRQPGRMVSVIDGFRTRRWWEHNLPLKVADDATRCSYGVVSLAQGEIRLSKLRLKDREREREALLAKRWPRLEPESKASPVSLAGASATASPNLEFEQ
jgi:hypothetical protein